jgi:hypothetical protein
VLTHRLILTEEERLKDQSTDRFIAKLINQVPVPLTAE